MTGSGEGATREARVREAFDAEKASALQLLTRLRIWAIAIIGVWVTLENDVPDVFYYHAALAGFLAFGLLPRLFRSERLRDAWTSYFLPVLDVGLLTVIVVLPNPLDATTFPAPVRLRYGNEVYLFVLLSGAALTYSVPRVLWTGFATAVVWSLGTLWVVMLPGTTNDFTVGWNALSTEARLAAFLDPGHVSLSQWIREVLAIAIVSGALATVVARSRRLALRQVEAEADRVSLSRYFSPNMVDELTRSGDGISETRSQDVTVLFADMVGFTRTSAELPPDAVIRLLRNLHSRLARAVFDHGGTLDKYLGDGVMATFGTPRAGERDATRALSCARSMASAIDAWNVERTGTGERPVRIGIGVHHGPVVLGNLGDAQHLEFAVVGDTVNVASRLEELTRTTGRRILASDAVVRAIREEGDPEVLTGFESLGSLAPRGRGTEIDVWAFGSLDKEDVVE